MAELKQANAYFALARERERIRRKRLAGEPPPWTDNPILRQWRFTNVHREHDITTIWFRENIRSKLTGLAVVEATLIFRWFNRIETGKLVKDLLLARWDREEAYNRLKQVHPIITGAYMIKSPPGMSKLDGLLESIDIAMSWLQRSAEWDWTSLESAWLGLQRIPYLGPFLSYEIVTDLRWTPVLCHATDINTWANAGPGCTRGLGYVVDGNPGLYNRGSKTDQAAMLDVMIQLLEMSHDEWPTEWDPWELHEVEMWACEWAKYQKAVGGERLKRRYQ